MYTPGGMGVAPGMRCGRVRFTVISRSRSRLEGTSPPGTPAGDFRGSAGGEGLPESMTGPHADIRGHSRARCGYCVVHHYEAWGCHGYRR